MLAAIPVDILAPYERGEVSRAEMAAALGISERHLRRLLAAEREAKDTDDPPYVPLSNEYIKGIHYRLDNDCASVLPSGPFRIADHHGRRLRVKHRDDGNRQQAKQESKHKFKPKARKKKRST